MEKKTSVIYRIVKFFVRSFYPKTEFFGVENLPDEPVIVVGNHCQMNGPIVSELYYPRSRYTWCASQMMERKEVADYAFEDFWSKKPGAVRWLYRLLSHIIAPLSECIFNNADTIPVYHDTRLLNTFRQTMLRLDEGASIVIFPEHDVPYNHIICGFQDKFIDTARLYYKKTGKILSFVPMYLAPALHSAHLGKPIAFDPSAPIAEERRRICGLLMDSITGLALSLPPHRVVPYSNLPKKLYPMSKKEV